jgi:hypothetical protein
VNSAFDKYWQKLKGYVYLELVLSILLRTVATEVLILAILFGLSMAVPFEFMVVTSLLVGLVFTIYSPIWLISDSFLTKKLHLEFAPLEYSLHLFFKTNLSPVESIQRARILSQLPAIRTIERFYNWRVNSLFFFSALIACFILYSTPLMNASTADLVNDGSEEDIEVSAERIINAAHPVRGLLSIIISPPAYTAMMPYLLSGNENIIEEGSQVKFKVAGGNTEDFIIWNAVDTINFEAKQGKELFKRDLRSAFSFQPMATFKDTIMMDSVSIVAIKTDELPTIAISLNENRINREWDEMGDFELPIVLRDDYGVSQANVVATLSKGEGEAVKFRELKWNISSIRAGAKYQEILYELKIDTLSMRPGDELYFYFEVFDNKYPKPQKAKSDVYFLSIADTIVSKSTNYEGIALSVEAEYFKSQRQIIIDTEKLLAANKDKKSQAFKSQSNLIGDDQKILRLRYGVFLGEEFSTTGGLGDIDHSGHDHSTESGESEKTEDSHAGHDHEQQAASEGNFSSDIYNTAEMAAYVHAHDDSEIATFFDSKTKQLLKEALANMWEAELYLRTYKPEQALPYEYEALRLIKEVQQASRIYVERIGFEPPPLEPVKRRLTGELSAIVPLKTANDKEVYSSFEEQMRTIAQTLNANVRINLSEAKPAIYDLGQLLAAEIDRNPLGYGKLLAIISQFNDKPSVALFEEINYLLAQILPTVKANTKAVNNADLKINEMFQQTERN